MAAILSVLSTLLVGLLLVTAAGRVWRAPPAPFVAAVTFLPYQYALFGAWTFGVSHAGNPMKPCAPGAMQHVAFNVDDDEQLLAMRDRIRSRGVRVLGPLDHGFCKSIYFGGPENLVLEVSTSRAAINAEAWIDPEVVALNGISVEELARYKNPASFQDSGGTFAQPAAGTGKAEYAQMDAGFARAFDLPDEVVTRELSETTPPVQVAAAG